MRELRPDGGGQAVAHGAEAPGGHPAVRLLEAVVLRRPHLMLADLGRHVGVAILGQFVEALHRVLRLDDLGRGPVGEAVARPPVGDLVPPILQRRFVDLRRAGAPQAHHVLQHVAAVADDAEFGANGLVDRRGVDIDVNFFGIGRETIEPPRDPVVEARPDVDHQVALVHREVGLVGAVHPEHAQKLRVRGRICAKPHQGRGDREAGQAHEFAQKRRRVRAGVDDPAAGVKHRALGAGHQLDRGPDLVHVALDGRRYVLCWLLRGRA